jgi:hypothetical protein
MIWTQIRSGGSTSDTKTKLQHQMAALSGLSFYVDEMKKHVQSQCHSAAVRG